MAVEFLALNVSADRDVLVDFLCNDEWPFHARRRLTPDQVAETGFAGLDVSSFWIVNDGERVGLVRLFDLGDIGVGSPLFDLRLASRHRGRGYGKHATRWVADYLFGTFPELHRIEANTRHDNVAMQRVLTEAGFTSEGRLREAWVSDGGARFDTLIYGILRTDWTPTAQNLTK